MSDLENQTLEVLKKIQADLSEIKSVQGEHTSRFDAVDEQLEAMAGYVTFSMGKSGENRADIEQISEDLKALTARVKALEDAE